MVPGQLSRRLVLALLALLALCAASASSASAANRRVAISDYQWNLPAVQIELGEHVTWHWTGPDLMHSVTGVSENALGLDSDVGINNPQHQVGDSWQHQFDAPGTYRFQCKLHSAVGGTVTVSSTPGDPVSEPDPVPDAKLDLRAPRITDVILAQAKIRARGTPLEFSLDERSRVDAEYFRVGEDGREFAGYERWKGFVGFNHLRFGGRASHFRARPGRYEALLRATDRAGNISKPRRLRFTIVRPRG